MKIKHLIILLFLFTCFVNAQNSAIVNPAIKDNLQQVIMKHPKANKERVSLLNEYARQCFYNNELLKGFEATREARILSKKLDFEGGKVMYYLTLSAYFYNTNKEMYNYYQMKAKWLSKSKNDELNNYYTNLKVPKTNLGNDFESYLKEYTKLQNHFEAIDDKEIQAVILDGIVYFNYKLDQDEEGIKVANQIIKLYTELNQIYPIFLQTTYKMYFLQRQGKTEEVKKLEAGLVKLFTKNKEENTIGFIANAMALGYRNTGRFILAIEYYQKSLVAFERNNDNQMLARCYLDMGQTYESLNMNSKAVNSYAKNEAILKLMKDTVNLKLVNENIIFPLIAVGKIDEAKKRMSIALRDTINGNKNYLWAKYYDASGQILKKNRKYAEAIPFIKKAMANFNQDKNYAWTTPFMLLYLTECYFNLEDYKSALKYGLQCHEWVNYNNDSPLTNKKVSLLLSEIYEKLGNKTLAYNYLKMHQKLVEESEKLDELNRIADEEVKAILDKSQKEIDALEKEKDLNNQRSKNQRLLIFSIAGALISVLILVFILYRNNKNKQKANSLLQKQKEEIQTTLEKLEATQAQLIQSEKMASLGELTAGIAHEIQNPLNFVNNFSEVSNEMIQEIKEERAKKKEERDETLENELLEDISSNLKKINHHGKRADAIVKGMLQHSRSSSGKKEMTDLNALCDEYLRLSYHGLRAKDKTFNATMKTDFDETIGKINIIPQDFGRVVLNLINNAFYACTERSRSAVNEKTNLKIVSYEPTVSITTKKENNKIIIKVTDNGNGMPKEIMDKVFQPFFTTKPTGQGTGLGLSLSYDIITKAHGGELKVESKENVGTTFTIEFPIK